MGTIGQHWDHRTTLGPSYFSLAEYITESTNGEVGQGSGWLWFTIPDTSLSPLDRRLPEWTATSLLGDWLQILSEICQTKRQNIA